jgi:hypothetical protein
MLNGNFDGMDDIEDYGDEIAPQRNNQRNHQQNAEFKVSGTKTAMNQLIKGSEEIQWWLSRAISYVKPYIGEVTRYVQID